MNISIIIPHHNGYELLKDCIEGISSSSIKPQELIIVDNNSTDKSIEKIIILFPQCKIISLKRNYGFTYAINKGAERARGDYLLMLNNDCIINKNTLRELIKFLDQDSSIVATQPIIYSPDNKIENIGYFVDLKKAQASVIKKISDMPKIDSLKVNFSEIFDKKKLFGLSATCLLINKKIFNEIGMFDESFHSYLEDIDLFFRLKKKGYSYYPCIDAQCVHKHMATSSGMGTYKQRRDFLNWIRIIIKNYPPLFILKNLLPLSFERLKNLNGLVKKTLFN